MSDFFRPLLISLFILPLGLMSVGAQDDPRIGLTAPEEDAYWVGERVRFEIELKSPGLFAGTPRFSFPDVTGTTILKLSGRPTLGTEKIEGTTFNVQRHSFAVYARTAGTVSIPAFAVEFETSKQFGEPTELFSFETPQFQFNSKMPPGAETSSVLITTSELSVDEKWDREPESAKVGDAFTRTVTVKAKDVPAMTLPPMPFAEVSGIDTYPQTPELSDKTERGQMQAQRIDHVIYTCKEAGIARIPAMRLQWWNPEAERLETFDFDAREFEIASIAELEVDESTSLATPTKSTNWPMILAASLLGIAILVAGWLLWRFRFEQAWQTYRHQRENSEFSRYRQVLNACESNDQNSAYNQLMRWLPETCDTPHLNSLDAYLRSVQFDFDRKSFTDLARAVQNPETQWHGAVLKQQVQRIRQQAQHKTGHAQVQLPPLNPKSSVAGDLGADLKAQSSS